MVRSDLDMTNTHTDDNGRILIFDAAGCIWANSYIPSGSGPIARAQRENYCSVIIPQLIIREDFKKKIRKK